MIITSPYKTNTYPIDRLHTFLHHFHAWNIPIVLINDGPIKLSKEEKNLLRKYSNKYNVNIISSGKMILGRKSTKVFPGWFRSYLFNRELLSNHDILHIETDAFILSKDLKEYLLNMDRWCCFYSKKYNFPEISIQKIPKQAKNTLDNLYSHYSPDFENKILMEHLLGPLMGVTTSFKGDRYGENYRRIYFLKRLDYICQVNSEHLLKQIRCHGLH